MVKLTPELIEQCAQYTNPVRDRELDLRGKIERKNNVNCWAIMNVSLVYETDIFCLDAYKAFFGRENTHLQR